MQNSFDFFGPRLGVKQPFALRGFKICVLRADRRKAPISGEILHVVFGLTMEAIGFID